ncbi:MAG: hypothetical protein ACQEXQ_28690 [Bacillota bacterium]
MNERIFIGGIQLKFKYELSDAGWADGFVEINSSIAYFSASFLTDALYDLLRALISLIPDLTPFSVTTTQFEWHEEPGGTVWKLHRIDEDQLHLEIVSFEDLLRKKELGVEMNETCSLLFLVKVVVEALDLVLKQHGADGYKEKWVNHDFPMEHYMKLKNFVSKAIA